MNTHYRCWSLGHFFVVNFVIHAIKKLFTNPFVILITDNYSLRHICHCDVLSMYVEQPTCTGQICDSLKVAEHVVYDWKCECTLFPSKICHLLEMLKYVAVSDDSGYFDVWRRFTEVSFRIYAVVVEWELCVSVRFSMMAVMLHISCWRNTQRCLEWCEGLWRRVSPEYIVFTSCQSLASWQCQQWMSMTVSPRSAWCWILWGSSC